MADKCPWDKLADENSDFLGYIYSLGFRFVLGGLEHSFRVKVALKA